MYSFLKAFLVLMKFYKHFERFPKQTSSGLFFIFFLIVIRLLTLRFANLCFRRPINVLLMNVGESRNTVYTEQVCMLFVILEWLLNFNQITFNHVI